MSPELAVQGPQFVAGLLGIMPGRIGFQSEFDTVVSYMGALSDGTSNENRIMGREAIQSAARACRDGGSVIIVELNTSPQFYVPLAYSAVIGCVAWGNAWLQSVPLWQMTLALGLLSAGCGGTANLVYRTLCAGIIVSSAVSKEFNILAAMSALRGCWLHSSQ